jgi:hypothetical protein
MGMFGRKKTDHDSQTSNPTSNPSFTGPVERDLLERYVGIGFDKQTDLYDTIGDTGWSADLSIGEISFGDGKTFPVQMLGSYANQSASWLWAWANSQSDWPETVTAHASQLKAYGETHNVDAFRQGTFPTHMADVHAIGIIASGLFSCAAYYLADYGQGMALMTINTDQLVQAENEHARVLTIIPQMIGAYEIDHRNAIGHYVVARGYSVTSEGNQLHAEKGKNGLSAEFDSSNRLTGLTGSIRPD